MEDDDTKEMGCSQNRKDLISHIKEWILSCRKDNVEPGRFLRRGVAGPNLHIRRRHVVADRG